jgi:D-glycero-D-manno-heptose 1,7-bisphosphate phosphatase
MKNKAVFIDRDGTINEDGPYLSDPNRFRMYPGVGEGVKRLQDAGFKIIVITNQSGIGRGYFTEGDLAAVHERMKEEFARFGVTLNGIYYCPHHPDDGCTCRKPEPGLLLKAIADHDIDPARSYMIGDKPLDVVAGERIGAKTVLVVGEPGGTISTESSRDFRASDFAATVHMIVNNEE